MNERLLGLAETKDYRSGGNEGLEGLAETKDCRVWRK